MYWWKEGKDACKYYFRTVYFRELIYYHSAVILEGSCWLDSFRVKMAEGRDECLNV